MDHGLIQVRHAVHVPVNKQSKRNDTDITEAARGDYMPQWSFLYTSFLCNCLFIEESYMWPDLGKPTLLAQNMFQDKAIKLFRNFFQCQFLLHILIKQLLSFLSVKFEIYHSFLLGDMVVFIPPGRCAQKVSFPRSGHI